MVHRAIVLGIFSSFLLGMTGCYTVLWTPDQNAYSYYKPAVEDTLGVDYPGPYPDPDPYPHPPCYHCPDPPVWWISPPSNVDKKPIRSEGVGRGSGDRNPPSPSPRRDIDLPRAGTVQPYRPPTGSPEPSPSPRQRDNTPIIIVPEKAKDIPENTPAPAPVRTSEPVRINAPEPANDSGNTRERSNDNNNDNSSTTRSTGGGRR